MPDITLAHTDLNNYNQAPNYLANHSYIYIIDIIYIYIYIIYIIDR